MTSNELHSQIAAFVADRIDEEEFRARARSTVRPCEDCGPTFTRDLVARMALARGSRRDSGGQSGEPKSLANGRGDAAGAATRRVATDPRATAPADAQRRPLADIVTPAGVLVAIVAILGSLALLLRGEESPDGLGVRAAEEQVPVEVTAAQPQNLFNEAVRTFSQVASGALGVQVSGEKRRSVEEYFASNGVAYSVRFPQVSLPLTGGIVTRYGDRSFAQLVYSSKEHAVYIIETPVAELRDGKRLYVTPDILARLEGGERIRETTAEGESLLMFRDADIVITAVGNMEPAELERTVRGA
jgi:hypothetical protein